MQWRMFDCGHATVDAAGWPVTACRHGVRSDPGGGRLRQPVRRRDAEAIPAACRQAGDPPCRRGAGRACRRCCNRSATPTAIEAALSGLPAPAAGRRAAPRARTACAPGWRRWPPHAPDVVLVHDARAAADPRRAPIPALLAALADAPGAIPAVPVADTLKRVADGVIAATVPRDGLFRAQTPQAFRFAGAARRAPRATWSRRHRRCIAAGGGGRERGDRPRLRGQHQADLCRGPAPAGARHDRPS